MRRFAMSFKHAESVILAWIELPFKSLLALALDVSRNDAHALVFKCSWFKAARKLEDRDRTWRRVERCVRE